MRKVLQAFIIAVAGLNASWALASGDKIALVLGLSDYATLPFLDNPKNDATDMARTLNGIGFKVTLGLD